jgi:hypothetical protein
VEWAVWVEWAAWISNPQLQFASYFYAFFLPLRKKTCINIKLESKKKAGPLGSAFFISTFLSRKLFLLKIF